MNRINILDCTLRDGGYCNQWKFGFNNIKKIISGLVEANIDIIECGFLTNKISYRKDMSRFTDLDQISNVIPTRREGKLFVCMLNYGEYNVEDIPIYDGKSIDGIRVAFHKKDLSEALKLCENIQAKGYKVFVQPMLTLNYSDEEFLSLIKECNRIGVYAFYIVDSFGVMKRKQLIRLFHMVEFNLNDNILIGFHSHNNMQLAYSNAQHLVNIQTRKKLIIDSSVFGMGRGAGNLNTELFVEYLNEYENNNYNLKSLLSIIDEVLNKFYQESYWGYSLPNYLSASHNAHPNYAGYLDDKKTLTVENMDERFKLMDEDKKSVFDKQYIEELYIQYMASSQIYEEHLVELKKKLYGKRVLIIAPGKSAEEEKKKIQMFANQSDIVSISVNFDYKNCDTDFIFLSNLRRFREIDDSKLSKMIVTSNIPGKGVYLQTKYKNLINDIESVKDNAGMMLIKFLISLGVNEIYLAGMDGYSHDIDDNYAEHNMAFVTKRAILDAMNLGMCKVLNQYSKQVNIYFLTEPKFVNINLT